MNYQVDIIKMAINREKAFRPKTGRIIIVFLLLFAIGVELFTTTEQIWAADVQVLTPPSGAKIIARNPETHLVLRYPEGGNANRVMAEKSGAMLEPFVAMEGDAYTYQHFRLPLNPGKNIFTIVPGGQRLELTYQPLKGLLPLNMKDIYLFHQDSQLPESCVDCHDLQESKNIDQLGLKRQTSCVVCHENVVGKNKFEHSATLNQQCLACHQKYVKPWRIGFREGRIDDTCFTCHSGRKTWQSSKYRHGALIGGCTLCHNPHGSEYRYQLWAESSFVICVTCHDDKQNLVNKNNHLPYVHGIIFGKGCVACHDPHATDEEFMLLKPVNELCVSCHHGMEGIKRGHPVANHPVASPAERHRPGHELTCVGCHNPHGSSHQYLLIETNLGGRLCRVCHKR